MEFNNWMNIKIEEVEMYLENYLSYKKNKQYLIYESMRYSLFAGGKKIRPVLLIATYEMFGKDLKSIMPFACALEMIHTYSLIHDDLPAMDNDNLRRGKPTNHIKYGEAMAILAGDGLLNKAFETILNNTSNISQEILLRCLKILANSAGSEGMIGGQIVDMFVEEQSLDYLEYMHRLKTGAIISASCEIGAVLGNATDIEINAIKEYANYLGLAFQIKDDILDNTSSLIELGKPIGSDIKNNKLTYVSLLGMDESEKLLKKYTEKAIDSIEMFGDGGLKLKEIAEYLLERKR